MNEHEFHQLLNDRRFGPVRAVEYEPNQRPPLHAECSGPEGAAGILGTDEASD